MNCHKQVDRVALRDRNTNLLNWVKEISLTIFSGRHRPHKKITMLIMDITYIGLNRTDAIAHP